MVFLFPIFITLCKIPMRWVYEVTKQSKAEIMIADSCIIIDFKRAEPKLFSKIACTLNPLNIAESLLEELETEFLDDNVVTSLNKLGVTVVPVHLDDLAIAVTESQTGALSTYDRICLYTAKRMGYTCVTNDKKLRAECKRHKVPVLWGLEIIVMLYQNKGITRKEARDIGEAIYKNSFGRITKDIYDRFMTLVTN